MVDIELVTRLAAAPWCPTRRALVARVREPARVTWAAHRAPDFTVYVDDALAARGTYRVTKKAVAVCIPAARTPVVLVYGPDSRGQPVQYDSTVPAVEEAGK